MNVELVNPMSVFRLFERSDAARPQPSQWRTPAWAKQLWPRLGEQIRYQRALHQLHQLDDRDLDDLDIARADFPALAGRYAKGLEPLPRA
jgi:uncharacterized protein YjiS (DUF1127 family)